MNDTRYHRSQATVSTLSKVFYTPGGPERFFEFFLFSSSLLLWRFTLAVGWGRGIRSILVMCRDGVSCYHGVLILRPGITPYGLAGARCSHR